MVGELVHPILTDPHLYSIVGFNFQKDPWGVESSYIELTLMKGNSVIKLKFIDPTDVWIERGFPQKTSGLSILDVSSRQIQGVSIEVTDFESNYGEIHFFAKDVKKEEVTF